MKKLGLFIMLTLLCLLTFAQTGNLKGKVKQLNATPFSAAVVTLWEGKMLKYETLTNEEGFFQLEEIATGKYRLNIASSLNDSSSIYVLIKENKTTEQDFTLKTRQDKIKEANIKTTEKISLEESISFPKTGYEGVKGKKFPSDSKAEYGMAKGGSSSSPKLTTASIPKSEPTLAYKESLSKGIKTTETYSEPIKMELMGTTTTRGNAATSIKSEEYKEGDLDKDIGGADEVAFLEGEEKGMASKAMLKEEKDKPAPSITKAGTLTAGEVSDFSKWNLWSNVAEKDLETWSRDWQILPKTVIQFSYQMRKIFL